MDNRLDLSYEYPWLDMSQTEKVSGGGMKYFAFVYSAVLSLFIQDMHIYIYFTCDIFSSWKFLGLIILLCIQEHTTILQPQLQNISAVRIGNGIFNQPKTNFSYTEYIIKRKCILNSNFNYLFSSDLFWTMLTATVFFFFFYCLM